MSVSSFAGYDFITQDVAITSGFNYDDNKGLDSHVLIHETGHMLGLNDYYNTYGDSTYSPLGGLDMMDGDFGDNNPYSKILLGNTFDLHRIRIIKSRIEFMQFKKFNDNPPFRQQSLFD